MGRVAGRTEIQGEGTIKQVKVFIHPHRVADVIHRLTSAGFDRITLFDVQGLLQAIDRREQRYSVEIGESVIDEVQIELVCDAGEVDRAVGLIQDAAGNGDGWIHVIPVEASYRLGSAGRQD